MKIEPRYDRVYRDATVLLRPKTGLKDMVAELDAGHAGRRAGCRRAARIPVSQTLPDVNLDEILAALDADTRDYLTLLLSDGGRGAASGNGRELANTIRRFEPTAKLSRRGQRGARQALARTSSARSTTSRCSWTSSATATTRSPSSSSNSNAVFATLARQDANLRETLRELPSALQITQRALGKAKRLADELGPTLQALRPGRPRARADAAPAAPVPARDDADHPRRAAAVRARVAPDGQASCGRRCATSRPPRPTSRAPFTVVNRLLDMLAYNPPGETEEGYLFWVSWANHLGDEIFATQDAHGPIRRGLLIIACQTAALLDRSPRPTRCSARSSTCSTCPNRTGLCPSSTPGPGGRRLVQKAAPSFGRIAVMVVFALSCFGLLLFLWLAFGGSIPLKPKGYRFTGSLRRGDAARQGGRRAHLRRAGRQGQDDRARQEDGPHRRRDRARLALRAAAVATRRRSCARRRCWARPTSS